MNQEKAMLRIYYTIKKKENCTFQIFYRSIYLWSIAKKNHPIDRKTFESIRKKMD